LSKNIKDYKKVKATLLNLPMAFLPTVSNPTMLVGYLEVFGVERMD
jgi:hypothetical protein